MHFSAYLAVAALACQGSVAPRIVTDIPPDSTPSIYREQPEYLIDGGNHYSGTMFRDVVIVRFKLGTALVDKQQAVDLIGGTVVGGSVISGTDGYYMVRLPADSTAAGISAAIKELRRLPTVLQAMPNFVWENSNAIPPSP